MMAGVGTWGVLLVSVSKRSCPHRLGTRQPSPWIATASTDKTGTWTRTANSKPFREGPKPQGPRPPLDVTGPRLPRLVQHVAAARCYNCFPTLPLEPNSPHQHVSEMQRGAALLQAMHPFRTIYPVSMSETDPSADPVKDKANECTLFAPRVTVARDGTSNGMSAPPRLQVGSARSEESPKTPGTPSTNCSRNCKPVGLPRGCRARTQSPLTAA